MTGTEPRVRPLKTAKYLLLGIVLCAVVGLVCFFGGRVSAGGTANRAVPDTVVLETRLSALRELATVSYRYTNMAQFQNSSDFYGVTLPFTTKRFILTYDGEIKAGVDLAQAQVEVSGETVTVRLPEAAVLSHEIDEDSIEVFDEKTSIFNPFTVEDFSSFQADQKRTAEQKAIDKGLLTEAAQKAADSVTALLSPSLPEGYRISVQ